MVPNRAFNVSVVPFAAVAGQLAEPDAAAAQFLSGQAFCFLPITTTDLPVHVNGDFHILITVVSYLVYMLLIYTWTLHLLFLSGVSRRL